MTAPPRTHLPPRLLPVLFFGAAHVALALAFGAVAVDPRGVSGFFYHARIPGIVHLITLGWITASILGIVGLVGFLAQMIVAMEGRSPWQYLLWHSRALNRTVQRNMS